MSTLHLAEKLDGTGVSAKVLHPGHIRSNLFQYLSGVKQAGRR